MVLYPGNPAHPSDSALSNPPRVLSVTSLNRLARSLLEGNFPAVLVEGEISNFSTPASGHWYLTLKDDKSQLRCAMFRNRNLTVRFRPADGTHVLVKGRLSLYEARGDYQLIIEAMEATGDGALRRAFEQLKARLAEEGLFDAGTKQPLPAKLQHIAVITSVSGAAIRDILTVLRRRFPLMQVTVLPVTVQGKEAAGEIVDAVARANRLAKPLGFDALLVARGGGSLEDLQPFNEETVARAIFASSLPVVSAVGHEVDFTITDYVADLRAPTPSAAAELVSPDQVELLQTLRNTRRQLGTTQLSLLRRCADALRGLRLRLRHPGRRLQDHAQALDLQERRLRRAIGWQLKGYQERLRELRRSMQVNSPAQRINRLAATRETLQHRLSRAMQSRLTTLGRQIDQVARNLNTVSPLSTLGRGFSITYGEKAEVLRNSANVEIGSLLVTRLHQGQIESRVTRIELDTEEE